MPRLPRQKPPGRSKQDYATPLVLLHAVQRRLGIGVFACDLASTAANTVAVSYCDSAANGLAQSRVFAGWVWLNPPFARLAPWVRRAVEQSQRGAHVAMLVPAGVGANWWRDWVHGHCFVLFLNGRITFVGEMTPYPRDCALLLYGPDVAPGYDIWRWTNDSTGRPITGRTY